MSLNGDPTRMPYRMHSDYLRGRFLDNDPASARYLVDAQAAQAGRGPAPGRYMLAP